MDKSIENADSTNDESLESLMASTDANEERLAKLEDVNKKLFARAKAAEEKLKAQPQHITTAEPQLTRDEIMLIAKGVSDEDMTLLKDIAALRKCSINDAMNDNLYKTHLAQQESTKRSEGARFGASNSSGYTGSSKVEPGMSREDHMQKWREAMGG